MANILLLSNGHGEDLSGALIAQELQRDHHNVHAIPLVGIGSFYSKFKIPILGKTREFTTGGLGYTSLKGRLTEIFQGQIIYLLRKVIMLLAIARKYDLLIVVGDVVPLLAAWLSSRPVAIYLVAYSSHYEGKLRLPWPSNLCLKSSRFLKIYSRDELTAVDLSKQLQKSVSFLGNPFMDQVNLYRKRLPYCRNRVGILPGSRRPELDENIILLLKVVSFLPSQKLLDNELSLDMALVGSLNNYELEKLVNSVGWDLQIFNNNLPDKLVCKDHKINIYRDSFVEVLQSSDIILAMAGTATEQAVGLGKPIVQFPGNGPQFTGLFAEAQRRLLGPTVFCVSSHLQEKNNFENSAQMILQLLHRIHNDSSFQQECQKQARNRLGVSSFSAREITRDIMQDFLPINCTLCS